MPSIRAFRVLSHVQFGTRWPKQDNVVLTFLLFLCLSSVGLTLFLDRSLPLLLLRIQTRFHLLSSSPFGFFFDLVKSWLDSGTSNSLNVGLIHVLPHTNIHTISASTGGFHGLCFLTGPCLSCLFPLLLNGRWRSASVGIESHFHVPHSGIDIATGRLHE